MGEKRLASIAHAHTHTHREYTLAFGIRGTKITQMLLCILGNRANYTLIPLIATTDTIQWFACIRTKNHTTSIKIATHMLCLRWLSIPMRMSSLACFCFTKLKTVYELFFHFRFYSLFETKQNKISNAKQTQRFENIVKGEKTKRLLILFLLLALLLICFCVIISNAFSEYPLWKRN